VRLCSARRVRLRWRLETTGSVVFAKNSFTFGIFS
jgi:hypothetical protein